MTNLTDSHERRGSVLTVPWPDTRAEQDEVARLAADILRAGGAVVYPTDTVYGVGADARSADGVQRLYRIKGRSDEKAIIWLIAEPGDVEEHCYVDPRALRLARRFWPGGLTLVLPRRSPAPGGLPTLGVRVPNHPAALAIIRATGAPVATTSANRSGAPSARTTDDAAAQIGEMVDLIIDAGPTPGGLESTVVELRDDDALLLRTGAIDPREIEQVLGTPLRRT